MSAGYIKVDVTVHIGEQTFKVSDQRPLTLSGDRRRHRKQIRDAVDEALTEAVAARFGHA